MPSQDAALIPESLKEIDRYRVLSELGRGAMGRVYLAEDPRIERQVALKVLFPVLVDEATLEDFRERFKTEARAAGRLNHSGIVTVYDTGVDEATGFPWIAMEFVDGESLEGRLEREGRLEATTAATLGAQVALALDYAHRQGVIHRDIKPANILITREGQAKVMDFGIAKLGLEKQTLAGHVLGTPAYMSPEQVRGESLDGRSDLFSLGTVLYEALGGEHPFLADTIPAITFKIIQKVPSSVRENAPEVPEELASAVDRALAKRPEDRHDGGARLAESLLASVGATMSGWVGLDSTVLVSDSGSQGTGDRPAAAAIDSDLETSETVRLDPTVVERYVASSDDSAPRPRETHGRRRAIWAVVSIVLAVGLLILLALRPTPEDGPAGPLLVVEAAPRYSPPIAADDLRPEELRSLDLPAPATSRPPSPSSRKASSPATPATPSSVLVPQATLQLLYEERLRNAHLTIEIDGEEVFSQEMEGPGGLLGRAFKDPTQIVLPVAAGERKIDIHLVTRGGLFDVRSSLEASFAKDELRVLRLEPKRRDGELLVNWNDDEG